MASFSNHLVKTTHGIRFYRYPFISRFKFSTSCGNRDPKRSVDRRLLIHKCQEKLHKLLNSPTRYQSIEEREDRSDIPQQLIQCECVGRYLGRYRGSVILKTTYDLVVYYQLFSHLKPKTILEMGTFTGASALWYADSIRSLGLDSHIYTIDIDPTLVSDKMRQQMRDNITLIEGDYSKINKILPPAKLRSLPHPWLVIEDGHNFFETVMAYLNDYMTIGDYLVVEDIDPRIPDQLGIYTIDEEIKSWGTGKLDVLKKFVKDTGQQYMVDSFFADYYGYNSNWHWHGFLRKCNN